MSIFNNTLCPHKQEAYTAVVCITTVIYLPHKDRNNKWKSRKRPPFTKLYHPTQTENPKWLVSKRLFRKLALMQRVKAWSRWGTRYMSWRHSRGEEDAVLISRSVVLEFETVAGECVDFRKTPEHCSPVFFNIGISNLHLARKINTRQAQIAKWNIQVAEHESDFVRFQAGCGTGNIFIMGNATDCSDWSEDRGLLCDVFNIMLRLSEKVHKFDHKNTNMASACNFMEHFMWFIFVNYNLWYCLQIRVVKLLICTSTNPLKIIRVNDRQMHIIIMCKFQHFLIVVFIIKLNGFSNSPLICRYKCILHNKY